MMALSVRQPWAWAILHGGKDVENRSWRTAYRGPLLIHAGRRPDTATPWPAPPDCPFPHLDQLPYGALAGLVELIDVVPYSPEQGPWAIGPWCWVLRDPRPFVQPVPWRGMQKLFEVSGW